MATVNVVRIRREIEGLSVAERCELLDLLNAEPSGIEPDVKDGAERERAFQRRMLSEGFLTRVATETPRNDFKPLVLHGRSASETLIEDRERQ